MRVTETDAECRSRINARVHASQDQVLLGRWESEVTLIEGTGIFLVGRHEVGLIRRHLVELSICRLCYLAGFSLSAVVLRLSRFEFTLARLFSVAFDCCEFSNNVVGGLPNGDP